MTWGSGRGRRRLGGRAHTHARPRVTDRYTRTHTPLPHTHLGLAGLFSLLGPIPGAHPTKGLGAGDPGLGAERAYGSPDSAAASIFRCSAGGSRWASTLSATRGCARPCLSFNLRSVVFWAGSVGLFLEKNYYAKKKNFRPSPLGVTKLPSPGLCPYLTTAPYTSV